MTGIYFPYFQPIVNLNDGKILSYEALARTKQDDKIVSAGNIFHSNQYTTDQIIEIDRHIRRTALEHLSHNPQVNILSLNISPLWIDRLAENEIIPTLRMLDELAIDPQKVVIEITELAGELEKLKRIAKEYQSHGIKIAVDDFGAGASQMDRILALEPEVIKLDMHILKAAAKGNAEASIALSFANLAQRSDSVMVCEGVETEEEFHFSIECGADCIQGWLFEPALANFIDADSTVEKTMRLKRSYLERKSSRYIDAKIHQNTFSDYVKKSAYHIKNYGCESLIVQTDYVQRMHRLGLMRYYICDANATQISPNYTVSHSGVSIDTDMLNCNWSHKPFFALIIALRQSSGAQVLVSEPYLDRRAAELCRTFAIFITEHKILLMDVLTEDMILFNKEHENVALLNPVFTTMPV